MSVGLPMMACIGGHLTVLLKVWCKRKQTHIRQRNHVMSFLKVVLKMFTDRAMLSYALDLYSEHHCHTSEHSME